MARLCLPGRSRHSTLAAGSGAAAVWHAMFAEQILLAEKVLRTVIV
jgi:hypothetical protein